MSDIDTNPTAGAFPITMDWQKEGHRNDHSGAQLIELLYPNYFDTTGKTDYEIKSRVTTTNLLFEPLLHQKRCSEFSKIVFSRHSKTWSLINFFLYILLVILKNSGWIMALSNTFLGRIIRLQRDLLATIPFLWVYRIFSVSFKNRRH